jgi:hypothetical protein
VTLRDLSDDSLGIYVRALGAETSPLQLFRCLKQASRLRRHERLCQAAHQSIKQALLAGHIEEVEALLQVFGGSDRPASVRLQCRPCSCHQAPG